MDESKKKKNSDELENEDIIEVDDISDEDSFSLDDDFGIDEGNQEDQDAKSDYQTVGEEGVEDLIDMSQEEQEEALVAELAANEKIIKEHSPDDTSMEKIEEAPFETFDTPDPVQLDEDEMNVIDAEVEKTKNEPKTQSRASSASQDSTSSDADWQSVDVNEKKETKKRKTKGVKKSSESKKSSKSKKPSKKSSNAQKKENVKYILSPKKIIKNEKTAALIAYLDELLCHLPKKRIEQFARSEHFSTYEEIMEKIQKSPE